MTLALASGARQVAGQGGWSLVHSISLERTEVSTPSLSEQGAGGSANIPGLGFGTARIHSGCKLFLAWLHLGVQ